MTHISGVPFFKQDTEYSCGPTSLQMVLANVGIKESEERLMHAAHTGKEAGTHHEWMMRTARSHGLYVYVNNGSSFDEIEMLLKEGYPVIVHYIEIVDNEEHYAVVTGIDEDSITFNDPWYGPNYKLPKKVFQERWHDEKGEYKEWIMAVSKTPFSTGVQYHPAVERAS
jgi:predicted double-glycine peptidase